MEPTFKDYYTTLGVSSDADEQTIKQAYRKLARQYHPDVNPDDAKAGERFKEINEAYQALSDLEKRRKYDALRQQYQQWQQQGGSDAFNWNQWQATPGERGVYTYTVSMDDLEDMFGNASPFSDFFSSMFGFGQAGPTEREPTPRRGRDSEVTTEISLTEAFHGTNRTLQVGERRIEARIPAGVRTGSRVRLSGQGHPGIGDVKSGDLYMVIQVSSDERFERENDDLTAVAPVDIYTAIIGGEVRVPTIDGAVMLKIPPRTQADRVFRLRGKGMPSLERSGERGDLYVRAKLVLPDNISDDEIEAWRNLAQKYQSG